MTQPSPSAADSTRFRKTSNVAILQPGSQWRASSSTCGTCSLDAREAAKVVLPEPVTPITETRRTFSSSRSCTLSLGREKGPHRRRDVLALLRLRVLPALGHPPEA